MKYSDLWLTSRLDKKLDDLHVALGRGLPHPVLHPSVCACGMILLKKSRLLCSTLQWRPDNGLVCGQR